MTVFCRDCKHCIPDPNTGLRFATCDLYVREADPAYLVTGDGDDRTIYQFCSVIRSDAQDTSSLPNRCGPSGKRFERRLEVA